MQNLNRLIATLLNISISIIEDIKSSTDSENITHIFLLLKRVSDSCPFCGSSLIRSKGFLEKKMTIPHLPFQNSIVHLKLRRFLCLDCHHSFTESHHLTPSGSSISYSTIQQVMVLLQNPNHTFSDVAKLIHISETSVIRIFDKHCHLTRAPFPEVLCIDEVYTKNSSFDAKYSCIFYDFYTRTIIDVLPSRHKNYLHHYFQNIAKEELDNVHFICIDMYLPYKQIAEIYFKKAIICVDSFHVVKHVNDDLSQLRIRIMKSFSPDSIEYYLLKHWKMLLFDRTINLDNKGKFNKKLNRIINYRQLLELILDISPQLKSAYELKERYMLFNASADITTAPAQLENLIQDFILADIPEYSEFVTLLVNWKQEIINSFTIYKGKRINNSVAESMNAIIKRLLYNTKGIRNSDRRKKRIMYAINKTGFTIK